jgi:hypothetical protein
MASDLWSTKGRISARTFWLRALVATVSWGIAFAVCKQNVASNGPFPTICATVLIQAACIAFLVIQGVKMMH